MTADRSQVEELARELFNYRRHPQQATWDEIPAHFRDAVVLAEAKFLADRGARFITPDSIVVPRALLNGALFHYWGCEMECPKARPAMAALAVAAAYRSDPHTDSEIAEEAGKLWLLDAEDDKHRAMLAATSPSREDEK